MARGH
jgi:hypothetical protein